MRRPRVARLGRLPMPDGRYRLDRPEESGAQGFETRAEARAEDALRAERLRDQARTGDVSKAAARSLARLLASGDRNPLTSASARSMRRLRLRFVGALAKLIDEANCSDVRTFTLLPKGWEGDADRLAKLSAKQLLEQLRAQLNRSGASSADGFLIAVLHGEFEPTERMFRLHVHGVAADGMLQVLDDLRAKPSYRPRPHVHTPVRLSRLRDAVRQLSYLPKGFWPARRIGPVGEDGGTKRARGMQRIPEPYHCQSLLWLHAQPVEDLFLFVNCFPTEQGLRLRQSTCQLDRTRNRAQLGSIVGEKI